MIIIAIDNGVKVFSGGYGDRIVGLISCKVISEVLNQEFKINWTKENIRPYFDYSKYDYELCEISDCPKQTIVFIDKHSRLDIKKCPDVSPKKLLNTHHNKLYVNREISNYLYKFPEFSDRSFENDIYRIYKSLYTDILIPTELLTSKINKCIQGVSCPILGIQVRAGDIYIDTFWNKHKVINSPETTLPIILSRIKEHIETDYKDYKIFITSDYGSIIRIATNIWDTESILYIHDPVKHMDREPDGDFSKIFVDNYILSQKTDRLYISDCSNYGRVAALSSVHDNMYNIQCEKLNKYKMLCKHFK
jgi:hypothetical protein